MGVLHAHAHAHTICGDGMPEHRMRNDNGPPFCYAHTNK